MRRGFLFTDCPRCLGGQLFRTHPDEEFSCLQCGYVLVEDLPKVLAMVEHEATTHRPRGMTHAKQRI